MVLTIIRQATVSKEQFLKSCPHHTNEALLRDPANELRVYVISAMSEDVSFQVYCGGHYLMERKGSIPNDERTGVAIYDKFMRGELI